MKTASVAKETTSSTSSTSTPLTLKLATCVINNIINLAKTTVNSTTEKVNSTTKTISNQVANTVTRTASTTAVSTSNAAIKPTTSGDIKVAGNVSIANNVGSSVTKTSAVPNATTMQSKPIRGSFVTSNNVSSVIAKSTIVPNATVISTTSKMACPAAKTVNDDVTTNNTESKVEKVASGANGATNVAVVPKNTVAPIITTVKDSQEKISSIAKSASDQVTNTVSKITKTSTVLNEAMKSLTSVVTKAAGSVVFANKVTTAAKMDNVVYQVPSCSYTMSLEDLVEEENGKITHKKDGFNVTIDGETHKYTVGKFGTRIENGSVCVDAAIFYRDFGIDKSKKTNNLNYYSGQAGIDNGKGYSAYTGITHYQEKTKMGTYNSSFSYNVYTFYDNKNGDKITDAINDEMNENAGEFKIALGVIAGYVAGSFTIPKNLTKAGELINTLDGLYDCEYGDYSYGLEEGDTMIISDFGGSLSGSMSRGVMTRRVTVYNKDGYCKYSGSKTLG